MGWVSIRTYTAAERPDLWERGIASAAVWPEYNLHGDELNRWWGFLDEELPDYQFVLYDEGADEVVAEGHTGPLWWDGVDATLPGGIDESIAQVIARARAHQPVNTLCALAAEVPRETRSRGLAVPILEAMRRIGERRGLEHLVAPLRPSMKERYPLTPIERYVEWRREDGRLLDPWMRVHERLGARVATPLPHSMRITGTVAEWEQWTGMAFPDSGDYVFPEGLATVQIDRTEDRGAYWEPNVWMVHPDLKPDLKPEVRVATVQDRDRVIETVVAAFEDDPALRFFFPDRDEYLSEAPAFVGHLFDHRVGLGTVWVVDGGSAVAMWNPPNAGYAEITAGLSTEALERLDRFDAAVHAALPAQPYWYLGLLATHPDHAGKQWGRLAMAEGLSRAEADGLAAVLETATETNVRIYTDRGWRVLETLRVDAVEVSVMLRTPH
jgi:GNAT superfamily N-acetyltransferase